MVTHDTFNLDQPADVYDAKRKAKSVLGDLIQTVSASM